MCMEIGALGPTSVGLLTFDQGRAQATIGSHKSAAFLSLRRSAPFTSVEDLLTRDPAVDEKGLISMTSDGVSPSIALTDGDGKRKVITAAGG